MKVYQEAAWLRHTPVPGTSSTDERGPSDSAISNEEDLNVQCVRTEPDSQSHTSSYSSTLLAMLGGGLPLRQATELLNAAWRLKAVRNGVSEDSQEQAPEEIEYELQSEPKETSSETSRPDVQEGDWEDSESEEEIPFAKYDCVPISSGKDLPTVLAETPDDDVSRPISAQWTAMDTPVPEPERTPGSNGVPERTAEPASQSSPVRLEAEEDAYAEVDTTAGFPGAPGTVAKVKPEPTLRNDQLEGAQEDNVESESGVSDNEVFIIFASVPGEVVVTPEPGVQSDNDDVMDANEQGAVERARETPGPVDGHVAATKEVSQETASGISDPIDVDVPLSLCRQSVQHDHCYLPNDSTAVLFGTSTPETTTTVIPGRSSVRDNQMVGVNAGTLLPGSVLGNCNINPYGEVGLASPGPTLQEGLQGPAEGGTPEREGGLPVDGAIRRLLREFEVCSPAVQQENPLDLALQPCPKPSPGGEIVGSSTNFEPVSDAFSTLAKADTQLVEKSHQAETNNARISFNAQESRPSATSLGIASTTTSDIAKARARMRLSRASRFTGPGSRSSTTSLDSPATTSESDLALVGARMGVNGGARLNGSETRPSTTSLEGASAHSSDYINRGRGTLPVQQYPTESDTDEENQTCNLQESRSRITTSLFSVLPAAVADSVQLDEASGIGAACSSLFSVLRPTDSVQLDEASGIGAACSSLFSVLRPTDSVQLDEASGIGAACSSLFSVLRPTDSAQPDEESEHDADDSQGDNDSGFGIPDPPPSSETADFDLFELADVKIPELDPVICISPPHSPRSNPGRRISALSAGAHASHYTRSEAAQRLGDRCGPCMSGAPVKDSRKRKMSDGGSIDLDDSQTKSRVDAKRRLCSKEQSGKELQVENDEVEGCSLDEEEKVLKRSRETIVKTVELQRQFDAVKDVLCTELDRQVDAIRAETDPEIELLCRQATQLCCRVTVASYFQFVHGAGSAGRCYSRRDGPGD